MITNPIADFFKAAGINLDQGQPGSNGQAAAGQSSLPPIESATDLLADDKVTVPEQIIQGVLHKGLKGIVAASSKARKTWTLLDIGLSVATGGDWLHFKTAKGRVLYVNLEIPRPFMRERIRKLMQRKGIAEASDLHLWHLRGKVKNLQTLIAEIIVAAKKTPYALIVVDPAYKIAAGLDENSAGDIGNLCNQLEFICEQTEAALIIASHFSKGNQASKAVMDRISGSGVFARDADTMINFTAHQAPDCYTVEMVLRNLPEQQPFVVAWDHPVMVVREDLDPDDLKQRNQSKGREVTLDELLELVPTGMQPPIPQGILVQQCRDAAIGENRAKSLIKALLEQNKIFRWPLPRSGARPAICYHRNPPPAAAGKLI